MALCSYYKLAIVLMKKTLYRWALYTLLIIAPSVTHAATYDSYGALQTRLQELIREVQVLQQELARMQPATYPSLYYPCGTVWGENCYNIVNRIQRIEADMERHFARVRILYANGRTIERIYAADSREELIEFLLSETGHTRAQIATALRYQNWFSDDRDEDDIDRIRVKIDDGDAFVTVYYDNGDTDRFTLRNETRRSDIIEEVADELDIDEDDVEDLISIYRAESDEVDDINITIYEDDNDARARVHYDDGTSETFSFDTDDEEEIIEDLADMLDMDEDDVEDLADFDYVD